MNKKFRVALAAVALSTGLAVTAPAPVANAGNKCLYLDICSNIRNSPSSGGNLLIRTKLYRGVNYVLSKGQYSRARTRDLERVYVPYTGCLALFHNNASNSNSWLKSGWTYFNDGTYGTITLVPVRTNGCRQP